MGRTRALLLTGLLSSLSIAHQGGDARPPGGVQTLPGAIVTVTSVASAKPVIHKASARQDEQTVLHIVDQSDIHASDRRLLNDVLMWLPALCRDHLRHLVVRYDPSDPRGQSTSSAMLIRGGMSDGETIAIVTHECGHIVGLSALRGTPGDGISPFPDGHIPTYNAAAAGFYAISWKNSSERTSNAGSEDFVSGYAMEDAFEDFAESFAMYALQNEEFQRLTRSNTTIARKYAFMRDVVFGPYFEPAPSTALHWGDERVWDITKLPHGLTL